MRVQRTVLKYKGYTAIAEEKQDGGYVANVKGFSGVFKIHARDIENVKMIFHQFADLNEARKRKAEENAFPPAYFFHEEVVEEESVDPFSFIPVRKTR